MYVMRYTIVDPSGSVSFIAPCHAMKALVAACGSAPETIAALMEGVSTYDASLRDYVLSGLAVFDEHNTHDGHGAIHRVLREHRPVETPVFRVVDDTTREASLQPVKAGVIVFNLRARRIVQIHNTYQDVKRTGRGRVYEDGRPTSRTFSYRLPHEWAIVP